MKQRSPETEQVIIIDIDEPVSEKSRRASMWNKKYLYGISADDYMAIAKAQGYKCASCGDDARGYEHTLCVDHDHATNEIRGLLCSGCNTALGWLEDSPERITKLAKYIGRKGTGVFIPDQHAERMA
ncbi:Recombination endonuclease VII [uncultured Caudovirales phage]|uniref:Recombination endonuclease VII n=1 Tax=uncultured Caudovirales phage TaxID=2100421 RepID=A0A6J7WMI0_9CAUD|nr:Recombination endonuclease VII [uncultured Caudovirales phage]